MRIVDSPDAKRVIVRDERRDRGFVLQMVDARKLSAEGPQALVLELRFIHEAAKEITNLAPVGLPRRRRIFCRILHQSTQGFLPGVIELREYADLGSVRGNLRRLQPRAVDVPVEVVLRTDIRIHIPKIDAAVKAGE